MLPRLLLLLAGIAIGAATPASAQFTYNANSPGCFHEYRGKCVKAKLQECRGRHESYKTAGCSRHSQQTARLECQNEVDRVKAKCAEQTCSFALECERDMIGNRRCARMPERAYQTPYGDCPRR